MNQPATNQPSMAFDVDDDHGGGHVDPDVVKIEGRVERLVYQDRNEVFRIIRVTTDNGVIAVVGMIPPVQVGQEVRAQGKWEVHTRFGRQLKADSVEIVLPNTTEGIERFLGNGLVPGIGPMTAKRIVETLGVETLRIIVDEPERLTGIPGLSNEKAIELVELLRQQAGLGETFAFLHAIGLGPAMARRVLNEWGRNTMKRVQANPYDLVEIPGIGFSMADACARSLGIPQDSPFRMRAAVLHWLSSLASQGHVYVQHDELVWELYRRLGLATTDLLRDAVRDLAAQKRVQVEGAGTDARVFIAGLHFMECDAAKRLTALANREASVHWKGTEIETTIASVERELSVTLAPHQRDAVQHAVTDKVIVVTGGPGTGKTTIIRAIVRLLARARYRFALAAPTGRAARRMREATGSEASTIHRLLDFDPQTGDFKRNQENPLDVDWLIIDESSMLDISLCRHVLAALRPESHLVLVGDADQLPSVGPGSVLADVIRSGLVPVVCLTEIFRQAAASGIVVNAHRVNHGQMPGGEWEDFFTIVCSDPEEIQDTIVDLVARRIPAKFSLSPLSDIQVLAPMRKGELGTKELNEALQVRLNAEGAPLGSGGRSFRLGDRVMQIVNNYTLDVMNGEVGVIEQADMEDDSIFIRFDERLIRYQKKDLDSLELAYACTIHKFQGSECPAVVIPIHTQHYVMLRRNLLYTGITRGKRLVLLIGNEEALATAIRESRAERRNTRLAERLAGRELTPAGTAAPPPPNSP